MDKYSTDNHDLDIAIFTENRQEWYIYIHMVRYVMYSHLLQSKMLFLYISVSYTKFEKELAKVFIFIYKDLVRTIDSFVLAT